MNITKLMVTKKVLPLILKAQGAEGGAVKTLRRRMMTVLETVGARHFVAAAADILKDNFKVEGCNDARIPLKRLFAVTLDELEDALNRKKFRLAGWHPIAGLTEEHKTGLRHFRELDAVVKEAKKGALGLKTAAGAGKFSAYFSELDAHIRKEEEVLFPALEASGMTEHPENLRQEHKRFRAVLKELVEIFADAGLTASPAGAQRIVALGEEFLSAICNHIFRETYIFYPAALEFIRGEKKWREIGKEFALA